MSASREPILDLRFADPWAAESEPDGSTWLAAEPLTELEFMDDSLDHASIPEAELADLPATTAWNLGATLRRAVVAATACAPLLLHPTSAIASPPAPAPAPALDANLTAPSIGSPSPAVSSIWDTLTNRRVILTLADGSRTRGTVLGVADQTLVLARERDRLMLSFPTATITKVYVESPLTPQVAAPETGAGLIVFGSIATAIGGALAVAGVGVTVRCVREYGSVCGYYSIPLGVASVVNLAVGIPLVIHGVSVRKRYRESREERGPVVSGFVAPSREGVSAGVGIRF